MFRYFNIDHLRVQTESRCLANLRMSMMQPKIGQPDQRTIPRRGHKDEVGSSYS